MGAGSGGAGARIFITNDDGIDATGIDALVREIATLGLPAVVIAPDTNRSGWARRATFSSPVTVEPRPAIDGIPCWSCSGTPVDCVRVGLMGPLAPDAELVISGINHGPNLGDDALLSATVGAAIEGALLGASAIAVSQQDEPNQFGVWEVESCGTYEATARFTSAIARSMIEVPLGERVALNINAPADSRGAPAQLCTPGRRHWQRGSLAAEDEGAGAGYLSFGRPGDSPAPYDACDDTDFGAVANGMFALSLIPVHPEPHAMAGAWASTLYHRAFGRTLRGAAANDPGVSGAGSPDEDSQ